MFSLTTVTLLTILHFIGVFDSGIAQRHPIYNELVFQVGDYCYYTKWRDVAYRIAELPRRPPNYYHVYMVNGQNIEMPRSIQWSWIKMIFCPTAKIKAPSKLQVCVCFFWNSKAFFTSNSYKS